MLGTLNRSRQFKKGNLQNWRKNTQFWLEGRMRHLKDVAPTVRETIRNLAAESGRERMTVVDMGCGEGWLLRLLRKCAPSFDYVGLDFNPGFINALAEREAGDPRATFECVDFEARLPKHLRGVADIVANCFNFFEIPRLEAAFANAARLLRPNGWLVVLTIDPVLQLIAISRNYRELLHHLDAYGRTRGHLCYDKDIDVGGAPSGRVYKGILYSIEAYLELAQRHGLSLIKYSEIVKTQRLPPQIYQVLVFERGSGKPAKTGTRSKNVGPER